MRNQDNGLKDELSGLSPLLGSFLEERSRVLPPPPHYFDHLQEEVMAKIQTINPPLASSQPTGNLARRPALYFLAAASLTLLVSATAWIFFARINQQPPCAGINCLQAKEVEEYVKLNLHEFPLELILDTEGAEAALQEWELAVPILPAESKEWDPILLDALQQLNNQEIEALF